MRSTENDTGEEGKAKEAAGGGAANCRGRKKKRVTADTDGRAHIP